MCAPTNGCWASSVTRSCPADGLPGRLLLADGIEELSIFEHFGPNAAVNAAAQVLDELPIDVLRHRLADFARVDRNPRLHDFSAFPAGGVPASAFACREPAATNIMQNVKATEATCRIMVCSLGRGWPGGGKVCRQMLFVRHTVRYHMRGRNATISAGHGNGLWRSDNKTFSRRACPPCCDAERRGRLAPG